MDGRGSKHSVIHKTYPFHGWEGVRTQCRPQNPPFSWTVGVHKHSVIHKNRPFRGRDGFQTQCRPQKPPFSWTVGVPNPVSSTKTTLFVDGSGWQIADFQGNKH